MRTRPQSDPAKHTHGFPATAAICLLMFGWLAASNAHSQTSVVIITDGPRDRFDCGNPDLSRKRYQTTEACLLDLCGDVYTADRTSLYVQHPRTRALVSNPCYMLDYSAR